MKRPARRPGGLLAVAMLAAPLCVSAGEVDPVRDGLVRLVGRLDGVDGQTVTTAVVRARSLVALAAAVEPVVALRVRINPEGRVKLEPGRPFPRLVSGRPHRFLVEVTNDAGITATLALRATDQSLVPPGPAAFCRVGFLDEADSSPTLTGDRQEWKLASLTLDEAGRREVRLEADAGQGSQDLGFRATADLLLVAVPAAAAGR